MIEFSRDVWLKWIRQGFNYVQLQSFSDCAVLSPRFSDEDEVEHGCIFKIGSKEVQEMTIGRGWPIYVLL